MLLRGYEDQHLHTTHSPDGKNTPEEMIARAREMKLSGVTFTDHCETDRYFTHGYFRSVPRAYAAIRALRESADAVEVRVGIEIGQPRCDLPLCDRLVTEHAYDLTLVSVHRLMNTADFYTLSADPKSAESMMKRYFAELERIIAWGRFDVLAHLTYPLRLIEQVRKLKIHPDVYRDALDRVLRAAAQSEKGIEVNTQNMILPDAEILARFRAFGGRYITLGSDAHSADAIGNRFPEAVSVIRTAGFHEWAIYRNHCPTLCPLPNLPN